MGQNKSSTAAQQESIQLHQSNMNKVGSELATFGAGCFWGTEKYFRKQFGHGLNSAIVGYMGGQVQKPSYEQVCIIWHIQHNTLYIRIMTLTCSMSHIILQVCSGTTNHAEVLQLSYQTDKIKYSDLVEFFFRMHDPTTLNRQGNDRGTQYRSVIFTHTPEQQTIAQQVRDQIQQSGKVSGNIVTEITPADGLTFYEGEPYHQKYLEENPGGYCNHKLYW